MVKVMLDSGAFSVWTKGKTVDLDDYIAFCRKCKKVRCFVNLDVIPDKKNPPERAAEQSWRNYRRIVEGLPGRRVLPVIHRGTDLKWLKKYLDLGCGYVGIGGIAFCQDSDRTAFVNRVLKVLPSDVKLHGFGVASCTAMSCLPWFSTDSTTWAKHSQVWNVLLPKCRGGEFVYTMEPTPIRLSPRAARGVGVHLASLTPLLKDSLARFLGENGVELGQYTLVKVDRGYVKRRGDYWLDSKRDRVVRIVTQGVCTDPDLRMLVNARVYQRMAKAAGVKRFYLSGLSGGVPWLGEVKNMLVAFGNVPKELMRWL